MANYFGYISRNVGKSKSYQEKQKAQEKALEKLSKKADDAFNEAYEAGFRQERLDGTKGFDYTLIPKTPNKVARLASEAAKAVAETPRKEQTEEVVVVTPAPKAETKATETPTKTKREWAKEAIALWRKGDKESKAKANEIWNTQFTKAELAAMAKKAAGQKAQVAEAKATDAENKVNLAKDMGVLDQEVADVKMAEPIAQTADRALREAVEGSAPRMAERKPVIDFAELEARGYITPREDKDIANLRGRKLSNDEYDDLYVKVQDGAKSIEDIDKYKGILDDKDIAELKYSFAENNNLNN